MARDCKIHIAGKEDLTCESHVQA